MQVAEQILHDAIVNVVGNWTILAPLRSCFEAGLESARASLTRDMAVRLAYVARDPAIASWLGAPGGIPPNEAQRLARDSTEKSVARAFGVLAASELVFHHALTDSAASASCKALTLLDPEGCNRFLTGTVDVAVLVETPANDLLAKAREVLADKFAKKSLPKRVAWIHQMCRPKTDWNEMENYRFDSDRVDRLDKVRHAIVHEVGASEGNAISADDIMFMSFTGVYLCELVMKAHNIVWDTEYTSRKLKGRL